MRPWLVRTSLVAAACVPAACAAANNSGSHPSIKLSAARLSAACARSALSPRQLDALALHLAASDGDRNATDIQAVATTRARASAAIDPQGAPLGSIKNHRHEAVFAVAMHGSFSDRTISTWGDSDDVEINEIALLIDSRTGKGADAWWRSNAQLRDDPIDLSTLGRVIRLPRRAAAPPAVRRAATTGSVARIRHELPCHSGS
jgi:hypothetical protein